MLEANGDNQVCNGVVLTPAFLSQTMTRVDDGGKVITYHRHVNGGGWVADSSLVLFDVRIPWDVMVGPDTRVLSGKNLFGLRYVQGVMFHTGGQVSRVMSDDDKYDLYVLRSRCQQWCRAERRHEQRLRRAQRGAVWRFCYRLFDARDAAVSLRYGKRVSVARAVRGAAWL